MPCFPFSQWLPSPVLTLQNHCSTLQNFGIMPLPLRNTYATDITIGGNLKSSCPIPYIIIKVP